MGRHQCLMKSSAQFQFHEEVSWTCKTDHNANEEIHSPWSTRHDTLTPLFHKCLDAGQTGGATLLGPHISLGSLGHAL